MSTTDKRFKSRTKIVLPKSTSEELDAKKKAEEFWSDPCWTEPLDQPE